MRNRTVVLCVVACGVAALLRASHEDAVEPSRRIAVPVAARPHPRMWRDMDIALYERLIAGDRSCMLRFDPDLPATAAYTVERVVEGDPSRVIWYVPWVHDHPDAPPVPESYLASLREVLIALSTTATLVGVEGWGAGENLREEFSEIAETLEPYDPSVCARSEGNAALCGYLAALQTEIAAAHAGGSEQLLRAVAAATTVPIVGIEDVRISASGLDDRMRDRLRSDAAVRNTVHALVARGGGRAVLLFGMAHHRDVEAPVREAGATLDLVCMPHLCRVLTP